MSDKPYEIPATIDLCFKSVTVTADVDKALITVRVTEDSIAALCTPIHQDGLFSAPPSKQTQRS